MQIARDVGGCSSRYITALGSHQERRSAPNDCYSAGTATVAKPRACTTASCSAGRTCWIFVFSRVGCTRFVSSTTKSCRSGSIQIEVPVNPVCPKLCAEKYCPLDPPSVGTAHPSVRVPPESCCGVVNCAIVARFRIRWCAYTPPFSSIWQNAARSGAVLKSPAWPETPPMANAFSSCTSPCTSRCRKLLSISVGAICGQIFFGGRYIVLFIPSGEKIVFFAKSSSVLPVRRSIISAIRIIPKSEYTSFVPGSYSSGSAKILVSVSCLFFDVRQYSLNGGNPDVCVSKCLTVTRCRHSVFGPLAHSGKYRSIFASRSSGTAKSPSANFATKVVVATTFVSEAMSYIVVGNVAAAFAL